MIVSLTWSWWGEGLSTASIGPMTTFPKVIPWSLNRLSAFHNRAFLVAVTEERFLGYWEFVLGHRECSLSVCKNVGDCLSTCLAGAEDQSAP